MEQRPPEGENLVMATETPAKAPTKDALANAKVRVQKARIALLGTAEGPAETRGGLLAEILTKTANDQSFKNFNNELVKLVGGDSLDPAPDTVSFDETAKVNTTPIHRIEKEFNALAEDFNNKLQGRFKDKLRDSPDPNKKKKNLHEAAGAAFIELQKAYIALARVQAQHNSYERSKEPILSKVSNIKASEGAKLNPTATTLSALIENGDKLIAGPLTIQITGNTMATTNYEPGMDVTEFARIAFECAMRSQNQPASIGGNALQGVRDILKNYNKWGLTTGVTLKQDTLSKMKQGRFGAAKEQQSMGQRLFSKNQKFKAEIETYMDILNNVPNDTLNLSSPNKLSAGQRDGMNIANIHYSLQTEGLSDKKIEARVAKATKTMIQDRYGKDSYQGNLGTRPEDAAKFYETLAGRPVQMSKEQFSEMLPDDLKGGFEKALRSISDASTGNDYIMDGDQNSSSGPGPN